MEDKFTWVDFYTKFADVLLGYKDNRKLLLKKLHAVFDNVKLPFPTLEKNGKATDIDPFTIFGMFNKKLTDENRLKIIRGLAEEFGVNADLPKDFGGICLLSPMTACFFDFYSEHKANDIDNLWGLFEAALKLANNNVSSKNEFKNYFDKVISQKGIKWNITMGMFWIRPAYFIGLDSYNRKAICGYQKRDQLSDSFRLSETKQIKADEYFAVLNAVKELINSGTTVSKSLVEFSANAFDSKIPEPTPNPKPTNKFPRNLILYGVPGTGKTYSTVNYALSIIENKELDSIKEEKRSTLMERYHQYVDKKRICFTTFHQSYGYEDFIGGLKPVEDLDRPLGFVLKWQDGVFKRFADEAKKHLDDNYVIIIDEINRGQISKIFGELITLIEEDKRKDAENEMSLKLASGYEFSVPKNLYILGTMNTADKSISLIDAALRRRFVFEEIYPDASLIEDKTLKEIFEKLNNKLRSEFKSTDFLIGHAYFIGRTTDDLAVIMNNKITPLLYEYYFDKEEKVRELLKEVLGNTDFEIDERNFGRLRIR